LGLEGRVQQKYGVDLGDPESLPEGCRVGGGGVALYLIALSHHTAVTIHVDDVWLDNSEVVLAIITDGGSTAFLRSLAQQLEYNRYHP
jgi:hypothetical protein